jgi:UDP-3-O-[3-hydroxymyristoyl] glucosamine N-acyltransferase
MRVSEIAELVGGACEGETDRIIGFAAALDSAGPNDVAFVGNRKAGELAAQSQAGCLLVPSEFPSGRTLIRVADPRAAFARVVARLHPPELPPPGIHPMAVVSPDAHLGEGVSIGPHAVIGVEADIGDDCVIGAGSCVGPRTRLGHGGVLHANVTIYADVTIGRRAIIHSGAVIGADGFGFAMAEDHWEKFPQIGRVEIGDDVEIGANSCIDRAALGVTAIGDGVKIDNMVHIAHNCRIGRHVVIAAQTGLSGAVVVEDYAVIGGQVGIGDKARIESRAVLGSGSGVLTSKIVRSGQVVWGTPARPLKEYLEQLADMARLPSQKRLVKSLTKRLEEIETLVKDLDVRVKEMDQTGS